MSITFLSGLPRTGSTLLTSILSQNPRVYTKGNSALCQTMWDTQVSFWNTQQVQNTPEVPSKLLSTIPNIYYPDSSKYLLDKCRSWTLPANLELINKYITNSPKIIVMLRPIVDIVKSFVFIKSMNEIKNPEQGLLDDGSEPIMRSLDGVFNSIETNFGDYLYIWYDDFISNPEKTIDKIYEFCGWEKFNHQYVDIKNLTPELDDEIGLLGLHDIRTEIKKREVEVKLSKELYNKAVALDKKLLKALGD
jgi:sulfotransferase